MRDVHIHFLHGRECGYSHEYLSEFINKAVEMGLEEIYLLEHIHHFSEFIGVYAPVMEYNTLQRESLESDMVNSIDGYLDFIAKAKKCEYPLSVKFGLEVCYIPETSDKLAEVLGRYDFDFLTGGVHMIDGWTFDHKGQVETWKNRDVNKTYRRYYEIMNELCESGLFTGLAHPDSIKCFGYRHDCDLTEEYNILADLLIKNNMYAEHNGGLKMNYDPNLELGMNDVMLDIMKRRGVRICTASDAHKVSDLGTNIRELEAVL